ncbi:MAG: hypothetical protein GY914_10870 [Prochlorococcus sp.]|nr:hypothetical protein [Prochlorococcus sp.]
MRWVRVRGRERRFSRKTISSTKLLDLTVSVKRWLKEQTLLEGKHQLEVKPAFTEYFNQDHFNEQQFNEQHFNDQQP